MKNLALERSGQRNKQKKQKPFGAIEISTVDSPEWKKLLKLEAHVYNTFKTFYRGEGKTFKAPFERLKQRTRIKHGKTLHNAIEGLKQKGWIEVDRYAKHGRGRGLRVRANEYRLTFKLDYRRW